MITATIARSILSVLPLYNGKGRIIDRTFLKKLSFKSKTLDVKAHDGFTIRVWPNDLIGRHIYLTGNFDRCVVDVLAQFANPGACLWDIGANIGYVSCAFLTRIKNSSVVAIEPLPDVAGLLRHNLSQFGHLRSKVVEAAVSDHTGQGNMKRTEGNIGHSHITEGDGVSVPLVTSDFLCDIRKPDIIKIDVEGHECAVLRGIAPALREHKPSAIVFEHHTRGGKPDSTIIELLEGIDYKVMRIGRKWNGWKLAPYDQPIAGYEPSPDFVAVHR